MTSNFLEILKAALETQERESVGNAFGGDGTTGRKSFSITAIRNLVVNLSNSEPSCDFSSAVHELYTCVGQSTFSQTVAALIRFSFLIELTNLTVGSTKMKTRWLPGLILMPQDGSFEPIQGSFEPGNDPRSSSFDECLNIFIKSLTLISEQAKNSPNNSEFLAKLGNYTRIPYEFPISYADPTINPVHVASNVRWAANEDLRWLLEARVLLSETEGSTRSAIRQIESKKLEVKVFKTDRSLTGKDKTNRAKRWEVLCGDFQFASLEQCWSAERKLTNDLVCFRNFPEAIKSKFVSAGLVLQSSSETRCPITLEPLDFTLLSESVLEPKHGVSQYQIGHRFPLKRGGKHDGSNVCWQSADGNRIQGDLTVDETTTLLEGIELRRQQIANAIS